MALDHRIFRKFKQAVSGKGGPAFAPTAEEIDAFYDPLIKASIAWKAAQEAAQTPDQVARPAEMPPDQSRQEAR